MQMLNVIKQAALEALQASHPVALMFGVVSSTDPLEVNVDQRFNLDADFLIVPESLTKYEIDVKHAHNYTGGSTEEALPVKLVIREGLKNGDQVIMLRMQSGQRYLILDRVVSS